MNNLFKSLFLTFLTLTFLGLAGGCSSNDQKVEPKGVEPSQGVSEEAPSSTPSRAHHSQNMAENIQKIPKDSLLSAPEFSTFVQGIQAADLADLFQGTGPFTAFVPSNQAFDKFGQEKWKALLKPENKDELTSILIYHIVPGKYMSRNLRNMSLKTINGKSIEITVENGEIKVNGAKVIDKDKVGPNGVVHEIDTVLVP